MVITTNGSICTQLYKQPKFDEYMTHKISPAWKRHNNNYDVDILL